MKKHDRGIALITVLLSLALISVIVTSVSVAGNITYRIGLVNVKSTANKYVAESRMTRAVWNMAHELKIHNNRKLGFKSELDTEEDGEERFFADSRPHVYETEDNVITVKYEDANKGFDFSGTINSTKIRIIKAMIKLPFEADQEPVDNFIDKLIDYTDRNDLFRDEGMERDQYMEEYGFDLPRNAPLEYAEEALWIPGIEDAIFAQKEYFETDTEGFEFNISDYLRVVPYRGQSFPKTSKPNFFSSTDYQIMIYADLDEAELEEVREAKRLWYEESVNLQESMPDLYSRLTRFFSFTESKVYRIQVQVSEIDSGAAVNNEVILKLDRGLPRYRPDTFSGLRFWRKVNF
ncbi:MAG: hypothetical protein MK132_20625 [Lentisphaerales bacterium]|nr:hypothetical protein [Lentisphaerales bacterium]